MLSGNYEHLLTPVRQINAKVAVFTNAPALAFTATNSDSLKSITIDRVGENGKFFGFGICQKATIVLLDKERALSAEKGGSVRVSFDNTFPFPDFFIDDVKRNETNNELTITAYDAIAEAANHTVNELPLLEPVILAEYASACAQLLGLQEFAYVPQTEIFTQYEFAHEDVNYSGTETLREVLDDIAEATQTVYFVNGSNELQFKSVDNQELEYTIEKSQYFSLDSKEAIMLSGIASVTELGNNYEYRLGEIGVTQIVRDNAFYELEGSTPTLIEEAADRLCPVVLNPVNCKWRGNYFVEPMDKIAIATKDNNTVVTYLINDTITYNGGYWQVTKWEYKEEEKTHTNPTTLGDILNQTTAKVDKVNREITLVANTANANSSELATIKINTDSISQTVQAQETRIGDLGGDIETLTEQVNLAITKEQLTIEVAAQLDAGASKVRTGKNFTFDDAGLTIEDIKEDTNKVISTTVSNNGMVVKVDGNEVLVANDDGVKAVDLHATTYLVIGKNSRLEDMGNRTACFWIGG